MFGLLAALFCIPSAVVAQYGGYGGGGGTGSTPTSGSGSSGSSAPAPSAPANTAGQMNIDVAFNGNFVFNPTNISAPNGTLVTFYFPASPITHSVTQSSFAEPCTYLAANGSTGAGFDSGLQSGTQFTINITDDTQPIWFHCKQLLHCGMGMVGSINAPSTGNTFDSFLAAAMAIGANEATETDNGPVTGGVNAEATATPAATASSTGTSGNGAVGRSVGAAGLAMVVVVGAALL